MRNLIRVTNSAGIGMYRCGFADYIASVDSTHPTPQEDAKLRLVWFDIPYSSREAWYFGFASILQMRKWLGRAYTSFCYPDIGACVEMWLCPDEYFHEGADQAIFKREHCTLVKRMPYAEFYRNYCDGHHHSSPSGVHGYVVSYSADGADIPQEVSRLSECY